MELRPLGPMAAVPRVVDATAEVASFDTYDAAGHCRELLRRLTLVTSSGSPPWKWDILEFLEESRQQLVDVRQAHTSSDTGLWQEIDEAIKTDRIASTLPVGLRKQCEDILQRRDLWLGDFDSELRALLARGRELRERLLFEDVDRAGWFTASGVSPLEVQRLLERHLDMHQRAARLLRQLKLLGRALHQQGAVSSRRRSFQAKTMGEKLQSSLVCLAAVAVAPVPGSSEMWLATTTMMWLDRDQAWQHVVYEHPRDADTETILSQFQCHSEKARQSVNSWLAMPPAARRNCVLIHNASVRRVIVKTHLVNCIDGSGDNVSDWTAALDSHPLGSVMKKALTIGKSQGDDPEKIVIGAQRLAVVQLPKKPDANWGWRGLFAYGDTKVGECRLREGGVFSFICVDCGLFVGDMEEADVDAVKKGWGDVPAPTVSGPLIVADSPDGIKHADTDGSNFCPENVDALSDEDGPEDDHDHDVQLTAVEVVNRTDDPAAIKIYEPSNGGHAAANLFRSALVEGTLEPGQRRIFPLKGSKEAAETGFDVEITIGMKKAKCEVFGGQVIFVDGILADG